MNLLLVTHDEENQRPFLPEILEQLRRLGGGHRCRLVHDCQPSMKHRLWMLGLPTAVVSMRPAWVREQRRFTPGWAAVWKQVWLDKIQECSLLEAAGLPVPTWRPVFRDAVPDLSEFDEFVVVKPASGNRGAMVRVMRRDKVRWRPVEIGDDQMVSEALIVQQYIHTGPWPTSYRVGTVFGEPIYVLHITASRARAPFDETTSGSQFFDGRTIVASSKGCVMDAEVPEDVIELGRRVHAAFPTVPVLGTDIVRDQATGRLYVLEVNANGWTFHLTSDGGERIRRDFGLDLRAQFGGATAVARGIDRRLREEAGMEYELPTTHSGRVHATLGLRPSTADCASPSVPSKIAGHMSQVACRPPAAFTGYAQLETYRSTPRGCG